MRKILLTFIAALCCAAMFATEGALSGKFTINADGDKVQFSKGNLQATTTNYGESWTWSFATNQWDYVGNAAANNAITGNGTVSANGTVDLFGWSTSATYFGIHNSSESIYSGDFVDWGTNAIFNGGNEANLWRTLTTDEWVYLFNTRTEASNKYGAAKVNGITGIVLLPDDWTLPSDCGFTAGMTSASDGYDWSLVASTNIYDGQAWAAMEANGAVFLPAAGDHYDTDVYNYGSKGYYWSATPRFENYAFDLRFDSGDLNPQSYYGCRYFGYSVRLVQNIAPTYLTVEQAMETYHSLSLGSAGTKSTEAYTIRGYVTNWRSGYPQYQYADFFIDDTETGSQALLEAYQLTADNDDDKRTLIIGDFVEVTAYFRNYYGNPQLVDGTFHVITPGTAPEDKGNSSVADFISTADIKNIYHLTGTVSGLPTDKTDEAWENGIFNLTDATGTIYIYGLLTADGVARQFSTLDIENEDEVTLKGVYSTHNGSPMIANAIFISRTKHQNQSVFNPSGQSQMGHRKFIKDGQLLIEKNGKVFNAQGAEVK